MKTIQTRKQWARREVTWRSFMMLYIVVIGQIHCSTAINSNRVVSDYGYSVDEFNQISADPVFENHSVEEFNRPPDDQFMDNSFFGMLAERHGFRTVMHHLKQSSVQLGCGMLCVMRAKRKTNRETVSLIPLAQ